LKELKEIDSEFVYWLESPEGEMTLTVSRARLHQPMINIISIAHVSRQQA
jgi:hypothetical protein